MSYSALTLVGLLIIVALGCYAGSLALQLREQRKAQHAQEKSQAELRLKNDLDARQSIQVIARALLQKDLSKTEAAMRIAFLSQKITASNAEQASLSSFLQLAEATSHIPILDDWTALERTEKRRLTAERETIEAQYSTFIHAGAETLATLRTT
ncbi:MAG: DUF2489 domain-containing protein [Porticoccaceae bacterium]|nr:DUF2489 domain-containing protein [Porticoccaceae bacterium]MDG1474781.1 DUF2489 domain-containing protein [Porticoccaceae bacterium]